jgi:hypothetical protein
MSQLSFVRAAAAAAALLPLAAPAPRLFAQQPTTPAAPSATIAERTRGMERRDGFIPLWIDPRDGRLFLEVPRDSLRTLLFAEQSTGLGSNPIGIDRAANGPSFVARFERVGRSVHVVLENWSYRGSSQRDPKLEQTVRESFPHSTIAALPVLAEEGDRVLVDATDFAVRDWMDNAGTLARSNEGSYAVARDRSGVYVPNTRAFPDNSEIDVSLTFAASGRPGRTVESIVPDGRALTMRQHLSFVRLPDDAYRPRALDPRVGFFGITFKDYSQPIQGSLEQRWISRHRLERVNPSDPSSPIKKPIVYYIDPGIPEPLRSATVEGARWWEQAFDRAGLKGAFKVEMLPADADPMDARYNVVLWVNRNERGWSFGGSQDDPRTGEIIRGTAHMDSHRNRTDYLIYSALKGAAPSPADTAFVLGRIRQVTSHEMGHTLGMAHNFIASTYGRASVMDYPAPRVRLDANGEIDVSQAYASGPGDYDVWAIRWAYGIFPPGTERDSLDALVKEGLAKGYLFSSDADARPDFASDPRVNLWDDAATATEFLKTQMDVRRVALRRFGLRYLRPGEPVALLQDKLGQLYLFHRFALNDLSKAIGGLEYVNALAGDGQQATRVVSPARQREALAMLASALAPGELAIPDTVLTLLGPRPFSWDTHVDLFASRARPGFDEFGAARTLAQMIVDGVLQRDRAARLVQQSAHDATALTLPQTIDALVAATWNRATSDAKSAALARVAQRALADRLLALSADHDASPEVRAIADYEIGQLQKVAAERATSGSVESRAHWKAIAADFTRWIERRELPAPTPALRAPPGDPFGMDGEWWW